MVNKKRKFKKIVEYNQDTLELVKLNVMGFVMGGIFAIAYFKRWYLLFAIATIMITTLAIAGFLTARKVSYVEVKK